MITEDSIRTYLDKAEQALTSGDKRAAGILINQVLKRDFTNERAWRLLYRLMDSNDSFASFQLSFARQYFPDKAHLLTSVISSHYQPVNERPRIIQVPVLPAPVSEPASQVNSVQKKQPTYFVLVVTVFTICVLCGMFGVFKFMGFLIGNSSEYLPKGLTPGLWVATEGYALGNDSFWDAASGYSADFFLLPLKDRPDCIYKNFSICELLDDKTLKITLSGQVLILQVKEYTDNTITLMDIETGNGCIFQKLADDTSKDDLEKSIIGKWTAIPVMAPVIEGLNIEPEFLLEFKPDNKVIFTNLTLTSGESREEINYELNKYMLTIYGSSDFNPFPLRIMEDFGDVLLLNYDEEYDGIPYGPRMILVREK